MVAHLDSSAIENNSTSVDDANVISDFKNPQEPGSGIDLHEVNQNSTEVGELLQEYESVLNGTWTTFYYVLSTLVACGLVLVAVGVGVYLLKRKGFIGRPRVAKIENPKYSLPLRSGSSCRYSKGAILHTGPTVKFDGDNIPVLTRRENVTKARRSLAAEMGDSEEESRPSDRIEVTPGADPKLRSALEFMIPAPENCYSPALASRR